MTFVSGVIVFLCGFFNLGFLMQFISTPTITGFMNGASITIMSAQLKRLSGIKSGSTAQFADSWKTMFTYYDEIKWTDSLLGLTSLVLLLSIREIAFLCQRNGNQPFNLVGEVKPGLPTFALPPLSTVFEGKTYNFKDMFSSLGLSLLSVPLVSIIELVAIAKSFSKGKVIDVTQELLALGLCNIGSSFFRSIPITGSFTRSAVNNASGVKTTLGGIFTGVLVLFALGVLSEAFYYIPRTSLAAVIIAAMLTLVEVRKVLEIYRTKRIEILIFLGTFLVSLWQGLEIGILVGVGINVLFTLYNTSRPVIDMSETMVRLNAISFVNLS
jgi:solute carrier family 26 (sodium-independent sulfate anion transporter), member 11